MQSKDYLDITLNSNDGTYRPFHKPNKETTYIHLEIGYPSQIVKKRNTRSIEKRLSSTKKIFENLKATMSCVYGNTDITKN